MRKTSLAFLLVCVLPLSCGMKIGGQSSPPSVNSSGLQPLGVGASWTYSVTPLPQGTAVCGTGPVTQTVTATSSLGGQTAYQLSAFCPGQATQQLAFDGQRVLVYYGSRWATALDTPPTDGHTWSGDQNYIWSSAGTVTVTAGTFQNCWQRRQTDSSSTTFQTYCPGIGKVIDHSDMDGIGYDAQLTGKNF